MTRYIEQLVNKIYQVRNDPHEYRVKDEQTRESKYKKCCLVLGPKFIHNFLILTMIYLKITNL
jgi:hypothetical protein